MHEAFAHEDPASEWIQVTDEETGRMVAAANWRLRRGVAEGEDGTNQVEKSLEEAPQTLSLFAAGAKEWAKVRSRFFPNVDHLSKLALTHRFLGLHSSHGQVSLLTVNVGRTGRLGTYWKLQPNRKLLEAPKSLMSKNLMSMSKAYAYFSLSGCTP